MSLSLARATAIAAVVTVICFLVAGAVGQDQDGWAGDALPQWLGNVAWFGLLVGIVVTVVLGVLLLVTRLRGRSTS
jgi:hypothetical protein